MNESLTAISNELQEEHARLSEQSESLAAELRRVEQQLKQVRSAVKALTGKPSAKPAGKTSKPCASKADVVLVIETLLRSQPAMSLADLRTRVEQRIVKAGKSRMGLALRFKEAIATSRFRETEHGVSLATNDRLPVNCPKGEPHGDQTD
ncbi:hypothetical protein NG895_02160 [Aeoliella sp. ICT_H6.2]|uniref:Uncharacterized protein n=1 Tax=Aeoliella straminimaris TaxID=2954799 RepID=A0A9X2JE75_9BACT|nr:hypothetical protein [Aeoliella straminimaris]MCO6042700.1 hypothetical protein [Aeoliella straminimaris]